MMYLVKGTAPIISVGKIVREQRFKYVWDPDEGPYFELPNGKIVRCSTAVDVPYVAAATGSPPSPAPSTPVRNAGGDLSSPASPESQIIVSPHDVLSQAGSPAPALGPGGCSDVVQVVVPIDPLVYEQAGSQRRRKRRMIRRKQHTMGSL